MQDITKVFHPLWLLCFLILAWSKANLVCIPKRKIHYLIPHVGSYKISDALKRRIFFETFAKEKGFDPLLPENWYSVKYMDIEEIPVFVFYLLSRSIYLLLQGYSGVLQDFRDLSAALTTVFPDIGLDESKFERSMLNYCIAHTYLH